MPNGLGGRRHLGCPSSYHSNDPQVNEIIPLAPGRPYYPGSPLAGGQLRLNSVADGRRRRGFRGRLILLDFAALDLLDGGAVAVRCIDGPSSRRRRSSISVLWQSASMFSPSSTNAPKVAMRETFPFTSCPTL